MEDLSSRPAHEVLDDHPNLAEIGGEGGFERGLENRLGSFGRRAHLSDARRSSEEPHLEGKAFPSRLTNLRAVGGTCALRRLRDGHRPDRA